MLFAGILACLLPGNTLLAQSDRLPVQGGEIVLTPVLHATTVLQWGETTIYMDPYGGADRFNGLEAPDLICITHAHGDHLDPVTLEGLDLSQATLVAPRSVVQKLNGITFARIEVLQNGEEIELMGMTIEAIPMYNLPDDETSRHPKGWGNGYVLHIGGKKLYFSGDTEDIREMRSLKDIDYAFVCMNLPYTMDVEQAASAVLDFKPKVVYPYHYRGRPDFSDVNAFERLVNKGEPAIEVRLRNWYPEK